MLGSDATSDEVTPWSLEWVLSPLPPVVFVFPSDSSPTNSLRSLPDQPPSTPMQLTLGGNYGWVIATAVGSVLVVNGWMSIQVGKVSRGLADEVVGCQGTVIRRAGTTCPRPYHQAVRRWAIPTHTAACSTLRGPNPDMHKLGGGHIWIVP